MPERCARLVMVLVLVCVCIMGCFHHKEPAPATSRIFMTPDAQQGLWIDCEGGYGECLDEAQRRCPRGYVTLDVGLRAAADQQKGVAIQCRMPSPIALPAQPLPNGAKVWLFRDPRGVVYRVPPERRAEALRAGLVETGAE